MTILTLQFFTPYQYFHFSSRDDFNEHEVENKTKTTPHQKKKNQLGKLLIELIPSSSPEIYGRVHNILKGQTARKSKY